jgi:ABC-2 type transport system permease protein
MARTFRTLLQSIVSPVISTSLYFVVFGAAIGSRMQRSAACPMAPSSCPG